MCQSKGMQWCSCATAGLCERIRAQLGQPGACPPPPPVPGKWDGGAVCRCHSDGDMWRQCYGPLQHQSSSCHFYWLGFHPLGRVFSDFRKIICVELGYPKGLMLKGQDGEAVKGQSTKLGAVGRAGGNSPPHPCHLGAGQVCAEGTSTLSAAEAWGPDRVQRGSTT